MQSLIIFLGLCLIEGYSLVMVKHSFDEDSIFMRILSIGVLVLATGIMIASLFALREAIQYQTLDSYFEGRVEVIEQIDTVRTYKFIKHE